MKIKPILITLAMVLPTAFSHAQGPGGPRGPGPSGPPPGPGGNSSQQQGAPPPMPPGPPMPPPIVAALDKDDDGIISAQEIADSPDSLKTLDKNGDGQLTPDEYFGPKPDGRKHSGGGNSGTSGSSSPLSATTSGTSGMGHTMDPPNSGKSGKKHHGPPLQLVEALDANADGVISADEITNAPAALKTLDKNNDGQLGPREYGPKPPPLPKELEPYDTNGNGRIDPDEMAAVQADIKSGKLKLPPPPQGGPGQADE